MISLTAHLLSSVLLDNSASPLMHCLETTDLGQSPSPLCGMDDSQKEILFMCGLAGSERKHADEVEKLIIGQLETLVAEGIPKADIDAALHQLELQQREVGGGGYPYGLQLILNALTAATHRGDSAGLLDVDAILASLRIKLEDPNFFPAVIDKLLIKNRHRVTLVLSPDKQMRQVKEAAEKTRLEKIRGSLTEKQQKEIIEQSKALLKRQEQVDDDSILPKVTLADVDKNETFKPPKFVKTLPSNPLKLTAYDAGTNGIVYQQIVSKLPDLSENELDILPIYSALLTEVGIGSKNYLDAQKWQAQVTGGLSAFSSFRGDAKTAETLHSYVGISGKALNRNHAALCDIMQATLEDARFDEGERILELVSQIRMSREQSITGNGHSLAMQAASQGISPAAQISFRLGGLKSISRVKILDDQLKNKSALEELIQTLQSLHSKIRRSNHQILLIGEDHNIADYEKNYSSFVQSLPGSDSDGIFDTHFSSVNTQDAWLTNTQVNFCAHAYPTVNTDHSDAAALLVLSNVLRNGFLHRAIREQGGAYGGGASQDNSAGVFRFYSYRDPRLKDTLNDFRESINWLLETKHKWQAIEEAILGVVSSLDKPDSPAGSAKRDFHAELSGRSPEIRQRFRDRLLQVNEETIKAVAEKYLANQAPNICVITDKSKKADIEQLGLNLNTL